MGRTPCCDKTKVKRGPWSPEEDSILKNYLHSHGTGGNWIALPSKAGLKRCGKSCRLRWLNYLRPDIKHGGFTDEEDNIILNLYLNIGSRWSVIASKLQGRTDNDVKNYWNTKMKKKLVASQRGNTNWNVSRDNNNSTISPKVEEADDEDYGNKDYLVVNSSTTLISNTAEMNSKEQEVLGSTPFSILSWLMEDEEEGTSTLPLTSWLMEDEEEGTSTLPHTSSTTFNTVPSSHENTPILSPSFSLENGDYGYFEGELGFLDGFDFQEEISELGINHHQANSNCSSSLANFSRNDAPQLGWYQNVINY